MKKSLFTTLIVIFCYQCAFAQKASDVLENGNPIKKGHRIFLKYDITDRTLKSDVVEKDQNVDFTTIEDSVIYLVRKNAINVYLRPLNPLNFRYNTETKVVIDPINQAAEIVPGNIIAILEGVKPTKKAPAVPGTKAKTGNVDTPDPECTEFTNLKIVIENLQKKLSNSQKEDIAKIFGSLKELTFADEKSTIDALDRVTGDIETIEKHFKEIEAIISETKTKVASLSCTNPDPFVLKNLFNSILKDFSITLEEQKKRLPNLNTAYKLCKDMQEKASTGGGTEELKWCIHLNEVAAKEGKISIYSVTIQESGYQLSDSKEIVSIASKELIKKILRVRKFQRVVPEVSAGTAFTFFKYYTYGTTSDATGQQYVGTPTENTVKNLNLTTMLNLNYYIPNSSLHPFYQIGVGINSEIPTLLTGFGLRSSINGIKRIAIASGIAMSWIKDLNKLKVGDKIAGTNDIDKDYTYGPSPKFTPYVAIQYNF